jgi:hypothetical protein
MFVIGFKIGIREEFCNYSFPVVSAVIVAVRKKLILLSQSHYKTGVKYKL